MWGTRTAPSRCLLMRPSPPRNPQRPLASLGHGETAKAWALVSRGRLSRLPRRAELPRGSESKGHETWCWALALG